MRVFKFGGASVKDAEGVKNLAKILKHEGVENILVVISAMGKMTNAFEEIINAYFNKEKILSEKLDFVVTFHQNIMDDLFENTHQIYKDTDDLFGELSGFMIRNISKDYSYVYDQIVGFGELLSTKIVSAYLKNIGLDNVWVDVRNYIKTDNNHQDAKVHWELTEKCIRKTLNISKLNITQGFLAKSNESTTTLGREGSDYTAGIFAYCLNAKSVTIWKDVEGVLNADPRVFNETTLIDQISYREAIEMAFYGASVIHPKTIQPLERKQIPLFVRSFKEILKKGTKVSKGVNLKPLVPCYIVKKNQVLVSISTNDFSFMIEDNISFIFKKLHQYRLKVNLIQNSAISFSVCIDNSFGNFEKFHKELKHSFRMKYNSNITLYTIRHFNEEALLTVENYGQVLLKQVNRETAQMVVV